MPTYEYECRACGLAFEKFQSMTAGHLRKCPKCGKLKIKRLIGTGAGLIFKGSGFYGTDYRSDGYKKEQKLDAPPAPAPAAAAASSSTGPAAAAPAAAGASAVGAAAPKKEKGKQTSA